MTTHVEIRTDNRLTTAGDHVATPTEGRELHAWPDGYPEVDEPVTWAVMDSGVHEQSVSDHPWFQDVEVTRRYDATGAGTGGDKVGHGTGVASLIARNTPAVKLWSVRIFGDSGRTGWSTIKDAYNWLIDNADELDGVNMSWGAQKNIPQINQLHEKLVSKGVYDVVAAGNTGSEGGSPATSLKAFSAGAVDEDGDLTRFTSRDPNEDNPDVAALGKDCKMARAPGTSMGTPINQAFTKASGTSFAAPYTSAAYITALYHKRRSWDTSFEKAAPDIPGSKADGEGLLKLNPALKNPTDPNPTARATGVRVFGNDFLVLDENWIPQGKIPVEKLDETKEHVDLRLRK